MHQTDPCHILALGFLITLYATLITLFGLAWVLFLIGMTALYPPSHLISI